MNDTTVIKEEIRNLAERNKAVILAHNYQPGEIQEIADFAGDSLELARKAARTEAEVIVFCGVRFMAETAAILSPDKTVLLPRKDAGCPMADMVDVQGLLKLKAEHPGATVVCYVNTTAAVKAECDICCTSANAVDIVGSLPGDQEVIFVPDQCLGGHVGRVMGARRDRRIICWPGFCPVHVRIRPEDIARARARFPKAEIWTHPECMPDVSEAADFALSTGQMVKRARETDAAIVAVATEVGMLFRLRKERPDVAFIPVTEQAICVDMKLTRLEDVRDSLRETKHVIRVAEEIRTPARAAVEKMLSIS